MTKYFIVESVEDGVLGNNSGRLALKSRTERHP
jgi:hypothetical protein